MTKAANDSPGKVTRIARQRLESLARAGVMDLPKAKKGQRQLPGTLSPIDSAASASPTIEATSPALPKAVAAPQSLFKEATAAQIILPEQRPAALDAIRKEVAPCQRCAALCTSRTQTVFGVGSPTARICFVGEAPGADEDRLGEPFVGRAGQLLTKMIQACGLKREEVYILNVLKCRPPDNRTPLPDEVANCRGFMDRQLDIIRPEVICCLGAVAAQAVLTTDRGIGKLRGKFHDYHGIAVICTYHPAYLLRNPAAKVDAWEDLKTMMRKLGVELK